MIAVNAGSRCAEEHFGAVDGSQHDGRVAGMVARGRVLLLVGCLVFLVHDDKSQVVERQKHR